MKANELRIGNWVQCAIIKIGSLKKGGFHQVEIDDFNYNLEDYFRPIPLTEDWLVKFGFQSDNLLDEDRTPILTIDCGEHAIDFIVGYYDECEVDDLSTPCKHLHQLQNLYFALTGEELTIKE